MSNGGINVEIGNPSYNMYEVEHDNHADAGSLLRPSFTLDPQKVRRHRGNTSKTRFPCAFQKGSVDWRFGLTEGVHVEHEIDYEVERQKKERKGKKKNPD